MEPASWNPSALDRPGGVVGILDILSGRYGNMSCTVGGGGYCPQFTLDASTNRLTKIGSVNTGFDAAGNMTSDGTHTYQWDAEGRLVSVDGVAGQACQSTWTGCYTYNALGQRVQMLAPRSSSGLDFVYGAAGEQVGEFSHYGGYWSRYTLQVAGERVYLYSNSNYRMLHANALGSATMITDQTGAELEDEVYYPWGQVWNNQGSSAMYRFAGLEMRDWSGFDPALFRHYNSSLGRWMSPDPSGGDILNPQSLNRYAYATNNFMSLKRVARTAGAAVRVF